MRAFLLSLVILMSFLSTPAWSETMDDLVYRDNLYYKKYTDVPFTGKITGELLFDAGCQAAFQGSMKNGRKVGSWSEYYENGQLMAKGNYSEYGNIDGEWVYYNYNGTLFDKIIYYKNDN